jgi:hypothetical protein
LEAKILGEEVLDLKIKIQVEMPLIKTLKGHFLSK